MGNQIELIKQLEAETGFNFSKRFKITMITVSILSTIIFMFIATAAMAKHENIVFFLFKILVILWISVVLVLLYDVLKYLKYRWDMRIVVIDDPDPRCSSFPQNAIYAKKQGLKFRKITKKERVEWELDKKSKKSKIKDIAFISKEEDDNIKLNDPSLSMEEFIKIREEQKRDNP